MCARARVCVIIVWFHPSLPTKCVLLAARQPSVAFWAAKAIQSDNEDAREVLSTKQLILSLIERCRDEFGKKKQKRKCGHESPQCARRKTVDHRSLHSVKDVMFHPAALAAPGNFLRGRRRDGLRDEGVVCSYLQQQASWGTMTEITPTVTGAAQKHRLTGES